MQPTIAASCYYSMDVGTQNMTCQGKPGNTYQFVSGRLKRQICIRDSADLMPDVSFYGLRIAPYHIILPRLTANTEYSTQQKLRTNGTCYQGM